jgi:hypothetical protein
MAVVNIDQFQQPFITTKGAQIINKPGLDQVFKKTQLPYIGETDISKWVTDADLKKLEYSIIKNTYAHRHESFWKDNSAQSFAYLTTSVLIGEGIDVTIRDNEDAQRVIKKWNDEINVRHETIEDYITSVWLDNLIDAQSLWRVYIDPEDEEHKVDIQRVSMFQVKVQTHPTRGWRRFIQTANVPYKQVTKNRFYRMHPIEFYVQRTVTTLIPDEPETCLYVNFFKSPPVASVMHLMVYKRWITWFMRKFAEKYWAPFLIGYVGDPKNGYMPTKKKDIDDSLQYTVNALKRVRNYGVAAFLRTTEITAMDTKTAKNSDIYVN